MKNYRIYLITQPDGRSYYQIAERYFFFFWKYIHVREANITNLMLATRGISPITHIIKYATIDEARQAIYSLNVAKRKEIYRVVEEL